MKMETVKYDAGVILVRRIAGDGHCLFGALVNQFHGFPIESPEHAQGIRQLRREVVQHMKRNRERFEPGIIYAIQEEARRNLNVQEKHIIEFFEKLEFGDLWGGEETIVAVSEIWDCKIEVYEEDGPISSYNDSGVAHKLLRIAFRKSRGGRRIRNHYDSVIQRLRLSSATRSASVSVGVMDSENQDGHQQEWGGVGVSPGLVLAAPEVQSANHRLSAEFTAAGAGSTPLERRAYGEQAGKGFVADHCAQTSIDDGPSLSQQNVIQPARSQLGIWQQRARCGESQISAHSLPVCFPEDRTGVTETLKFASWNVRGCSEVEKREAMDDFFEAQKFVVVGLQETRLAECSLVTQNYHWFNVNQQGNVKARQGGGTAILIHKAIFRKEKVKRISNNTCSYIVNLFGIETLFIATYVRNAESSSCSEFEVINRYIINLPAALRNKIVLMGDMNAWIGKRDLSEEDKRFVGTNLHHDYCNANGLALKNLLHCERMKDYLTLSQSKSCKVTWANKRSSSQLDHVAISKLDWIVFPEVKCFFHPLIVSDHKVVVCVFKKAKVSTSAQRVAVPRNGSTVSHPAKRVRLDLEELKFNEAVREKFQLEVDQRLKDIPVSSDSSQRNWKRIEEATIKAAEATLKEAGSPKTLRRLAASKKYFLARLKLLADRTNPEL